MILINLNLNISGHTSIFLNRAAIMRGRTIRMNKATGSQLESIYETPREFASGNKQPMLQQNAD